MSVWPATFAIAIAPTRCIPRHRPASRDEIVSPAGRYALAHDLLQPEPRRGNLSR